MGNQEPAAMLMGRGGEGKGREGKGDDFHAMATLHRPPMQQGESG